MKLISVFKYLLHEQSEHIVEFPKDNFAVSIIRNEKKMMFIPKHNASAESMQEYLDMLKDRFHVLKVDEFDNGAVGLEFDPREDFDAAVDFIRGESERDLEV